MLDHIAASPITGPTAETGEEWIAGIVRDTRRRRDQNLTHLVAVFTAIGGTPPAPKRRSRMEHLNPPDPNIERLLRPLRRDPTGGQLRALSDFEKELGVDDVATELEQLLEDGTGRVASPMGAVIERLRGVCQERRASQRQESPREEARPQLAHPAGWIEGVVTLAAEWGGVACPGRACIYKRLDSTGRVIGWVAQLSLGGRQTRRYERRKRRTRDEAVAALEDMKADRRAGVKRSRMTTGDYLASSRR